MFEKGLGNFLKNFGRGSQGVFKIYVLYNKFSS